MDHQQRIEILEAALTDYIAKYGLTEKARVAMIWPGPSLASSDAEPNSHSDNEGYQPPTGALSQG